MTARIMLVGVMKPEMSPKSDILKDKEEIKLS